jgi:hypothetical protein
MLETYVDRWIARLHDHADDAQPAPPARGHVFIHCASKRSRI